MGVFGCVDIAYGVSCKGEDFYAAFRQDIIRQFREDVPPEECMCRSSPAWCPVHAEATPDIVTGFYRSTSAFSDILYSVLPILTTLPALEIIGDFSGDLVIHFRPILYHFNAEGEEGSTRSRLLSPAQMEAIENANVAAAQSLERALREKGVPCSIGCQIVSYTC